MSYIMPYLNRVLTRSSINNTTKKKPKKNKNKTYFTAKNQYLNLKAPSNNIS